MPGHKTKTNQLHRVPCQCQVFECYLGHYTDAYGVIQTGVEVSPETLRSHALADQRKKALSSLSSPNTPTDSHTTQAAMDDLAAPMANLGLNPATSKPMFTSPQSLLDTHSDIADNISQPGISVNIRTQNQSLHSERTCSAAIAARNDGVKVYDCGMFSTQTIGTSYENMD
ncbi:hypothetical protein DFH28DRAFT_888496 [Melampsora americana]|nr:hypothetical protein DFH28DRAFT_888496 [Melampsora americana]